MPVIQCWTIGTDYHCGFMDLLKLLFSFSPFLFSLLTWNSIKQSGDISQLTPLLLEIFSSSFNGRFELLNEIFSASNELEWIEYVQEQIIDVIWLLGNQ